MMNLISKMPTTKESLLERFIDSQGMVGEFVISYVDNQKEKGEQNMDLQIIKREFSICKVEKVEQDLLNQEFVFVGKTDQEISIICETGLVPREAVQIEHGWSCFRIAEDAAFEKYGMIAFLSEIIAKEKTGILVVATYDTDYILLKKEKFADVKKALELNGCRFIEEK